MIYGVTGTDVTDQVGKGEQAEIEMQAGVDIQAGMDKHEVGFGQCGLKVHELTVKKLMVPEEEEE